jgi:hypothetical protein
MPKYQVEITADMGGLSVWTCEMYSATSENAAENKAIKASEKSGHTNQREIKVYQVDYINQSLVF